MSLARRAPVTIARQCARCLSSSSKSQNSSTAILEVLDSNTSRLSTRRAVAGSGKGSSPLAALTQGPQGRGFDTGKELQEYAREDDYTKQMYRQWQSGDVYAPHDLSAVEQKKWKKGTASSKADAFDVLGINPISAYKVGSGRMRSCEPGLTMHRTSPSCPNS